MEEMMAPVAEKPTRPLGRGGMTVSAATGQERVLGFWPDTFTDRSSTTYLGKAFRIYTDAMAIAQKRHEQNRKQILAKAARQEVVLPEPSVRASLARQEQKRLAELQAQLQQVQHEAFMQRQKLSPCDYPANDLCDLFRRQELRQILRESALQDRM
jgi:hypothetical protein